MKAVVTGAAGFLGAALTARLAASGQEVTALDHRPFTPAGGITTAWADIGDADALKRVLDDAQTVFHLAAAHLDQSTPAAEYHRVNVEAARALVFRAAEAGVRRFVHVSSVGVYGSVESPPAAEDAPKHPTNLYESTKLAGESAVLEAAGACGVETVVVRPAWVYGSACPRTRRLLRAIGKGRFFYFGGGKNLRHPVHVDDCVQGFLLAAEKGPTGGIYNLAGERALPLRDVVSCAASALGVRPPRLRVPMLAGSLAALCAETLFAPFGKAPPLSRRSLAFFRNCNAYSIEAARKDLGYAPRVGLEEGMRRVVAELGLSGSTPAP